MDNKSLDSIGYRRRVSFVVRCEIFHGLGCPPSDFERANVYKPAVRNSKASFRLHESKKPTSPADENKLASNKAMKATRYRASLGFRKSIHRVLYLWRSIALRHLFRDSLILGV